MILVIFCLPMIFNQCHYYLINYFVIALIFHFADKKNLRIIKRTFKHTIQKKTKEKEVDGKVFK